MFHMALFCISRRRALSPLFLNRLPSSDQNLRAVMEYKSSYGLLRKILAAATCLGYTTTVTPSAYNETKQGADIRMVLTFEETCSAD